MVESKEVEVVEILPDDTGLGIVKLNHGYMYKVRYLLVDGTIQSSQQTNRLLRDAKKEVMSLPKTPRHPTKAMYHDDRFVGTSTTYDLMSVLPF